MEAQTQEPIKVESRDNKVAYRVDREEINVEA